MTTSGSAALCLACAGAPSAVGGLCVRCASLPRWDPRAPPDLEEALAFQHSLRLSFLGAAELLRNATVALHAQLARCATNSTAISPSTFRAACESVELRRYLEAPHVKAAAQRLSSALPAAGPPDGAHRCWELLASNSRQLYLAPLLLSQQPSWPLAETAALLQRAAKAPAGAARMECDTPAALRLLSLQPFDGAAATLGFSLLRTDKSTGQRFVEAVCLNSQLPEVLVPCVACHELVHAQIWISKPYVSSACTRREEIICNLVTRRFATQYMQKRSAAERLPVAQRMEASTAQAYALDASFAQRVERALDERNVLEVVELFKAAFC